MQKQEVLHFTEGKILPLLVRFSLPVLLALFLQAMYGAVDLLVVGRFATAADVSAVATGSNMMMTITGPLSSFAMGLTVLLGLQIGRGEAKDAGRTIGAGIALFALIALAVTAFLTGFTQHLASWMHAPVEAFTQTVSYVRICGAGTLVIVAYNLLGSVFRGLGDSKTPLMAVALACAVNIAGDLFFVSVCRMGAAGAALATVIAQAVSVLISLFLISHRSLPFAFSWREVRPAGDLWLRITKLGLPLAVSDLLVGISFVIIQAIVNSLGLIPSAGVGVGEKVCAFIMLVPSSFMQSMAAFTAQNVGANKNDRALRALRYGIGLSMAAGALMFYVSFFHGDFLCGIFSKDAPVVLAGQEYLKAYAIDCLLTAVFFVFIGFYNGLGLTNFVFAQGLISAFGVRVPVSFFMSRLRPVSLFAIGLATPCSSAVQIVLCLGCLWYIKKKGMLRS